MSSQAGAWELAQYRRLSLCGFSSSGLGTSKTKFYLYSLIEITFVRLPKTQTPVSTTSWTLEPLA